MGTEFKLSLKKVLCGFVYQQILKRSKLHRSCWCDTHVYLLMQCNKQTVQLRLQHSAAHVDRCINHLAETLWRKGKEEKEIISFGRQMDKEFPSNPATSNSPC